MRKFIIALVGATVIGAGAAMASVNLNTATAQQLETLNGVGPAKAQAIIAYRTQNGPFKSVQDLSKVPGLTQPTVAKLASELTVAPSATTAASNAPATTAPTAPTAPAAPAMASAPKAQPAPMATTPASAPTPTSKMPSGSAPAAPASNGSAQ